MNSTEREDPGLVMQWMRERCTSAPPSWWERGSDLHRDYVAFCDRTPVWPKGFAGFYALLAAQGVARKRNSLGPCFLGVRLRNRPSHT